MQHEVFSRNVAEKCKKIEGRVRNCWFFPICEMMCLLLGFIYEMVWLWLDFVYEIVKYMIMVHLWDSEVYDYGPSMR